MVSKSICALVMAMALVCSPMANATVTSTPLKSAIENAVQEAVQKVLQGINAVGNHVETNINQATQTIGAITQPIVSTTGNVAQQLFTDYRNMGQQVVQGYQTLGQQWLTSMGNVGNQFGALGDQMSVFLDAYEAQFCSPAKFIPSVKKPAKFVGPAFELSFDAGLCTLNETTLLLNNEKELNCVEPSITFTKTPANFTSKYKSAPKFISKECKIEKTFGDDIRKVLYVFDGSSPVDINALTNTVLGEVRQLMGNLVGPAHNQLGAQLQRFMGSIASMSQNPGAMLPSFTAPTAGAATTTTQ